MKRYILALSLVCSSAYAQSSDVLTANSDETIYQRIEQIYNGGTLLNPAVYTERLASGRCFAKTDQNKPVATFLIMTQELFEDVGPIGNPLNSYYAYLYFHPSVPAGTYDNKNLTQLRSEMRITRIPKLSKLDQQTHVLNYATKDIVWLRQGAEYLTAKIISSGGIEAYCYYFKLN